MCGIVGYLGPKSPVPLLVESLRLLEYRGYDSAGVAVFDEAGGGFESFKAIGKLKNLEAVLPTRLMEPNGKAIHSGIGHIRWATHGAPTQVNAHPHISHNGQVMLVHNGIIENYADLRAKLEAKGCTFVSQTDTETVAHLLESEHQPGEPFLETLQRVLPQITGAYALTVMHQSQPHKLYVARQQAPLVIGLNDDALWVASDALAVAAHTDRIVYLEDGQVAELSVEIDSAPLLRLFNRLGESLQPRVEQLQTGPLTVDKRGFKHFMLKEIHEQPDVLRNSLLGRLETAASPVELSSYQRNNAPQQSDLQTLLAGINRVVIIGCGTSYNAGLVGKYFIEELVRLPVEVEAAGEYRYRNPVLSPQTLVLAISQSGETADTLEAIRQAKRAGAKTLVVTNREDSSMAREVDAVLPVRAGIEVSVCATKSFVAQIAVLYLLGLFLAETLKTTSPERLLQVKQDFLRLPTLLEGYLNDQAALKAVEAVAHQYAQSANMLFIARGINFPVALEGALKLKEISYIHAEGYSGAELKHGPIALLDSTMPVMAVLAAGEVFEKCLSNCQEAKARAAKVVAFTNVPSHPAYGDTFEAVLPLPAVDELLSPLLMTVPLQLLAYYSAEHLGKDVDQPRNLAKSVTVE